MFQLDRKKKSFLDPHAGGGVQAGLHSESSSSKTSSAESSSSKTTVEKKYKSSFSREKVITEEERRKIEEEIARREKEDADKLTGDGFRKNQRSKEKNLNEENHFKWNLNGGHLESDSHSKPVYLEERGRVEISKVPVIFKSGYAQEGSRKQESHSESRQGNHQRGGEGHSYYEEKEKLSNTTWKSGQVPKTSTTTKWKTVEDNVEKSGTSTNIESGIVKGNINLANLDLSNAGNRKYTVDGGGEKFYSEEKHFEKNVTWDSHDEAPKILESSSWNTNEDGVIRSGSSRKVSQLDEDTRDSRLSGSIERSRDISHGSSYRESEVNRDISRAKTTIDKSNAEISDENKRRQKWNSGHRSTSHSTYDGTTLQSYNPVQSTSDNQTNYSTYGEVPIAGNRKKVHGENGGVDHRVRAHIGGYNGEEEISSGSRRSEGKHKVHWSSERSRDSESQSELSGSSLATNVEDEVRKHISENDYGQDAKQEGKSYTEDRHHEWNTTWSSGDGGKPKTTELTSWKINEDGIVTNGSNIETYRGTPRIDKNLNKLLKVSNVESEGTDLDKNFVRTGKEGSVYSEEKEMTYNTTWNSARDGGPVTQMESKWKVNKDGKVSSGSSSNAYEGVVAPAIQHREPHLQRGSSHESRKHGTSYESRYDENKNQAVGANRDGRKKDSDYDDSSRHRQEYDRHIGHQASGESHETRRYEDVRRHGTRHEGSRQHSEATNINVSDLLKEKGEVSGQSEGFNNFGEIARGPSDGVARTYGLDLETYNGNQDRSSNHGTENNSDIRSRHYSADRTDTSKGTVASDREDSRDYSYRNSDRIEGYGGNKRAHSSWSSSFTTADGDRPQHGGAYGTKKVSEDAHHREISDETTRGKFQLYPRYKRETGEDLENSLNCGPTECSKIKCTIGHLKKDEEVWIAFRSRVWVPTMKKVIQNGCNFIFSIPFYKINYLLNFFLCVFI